MIVFKNMLFIRAIGRYTHLTFLSLHAVATYFMVGSTTMSYSVVLLTRCWSRVNWKSGLCNKHTTQLTQCMLTTCPTGHEISSFGFYNSNISYNVFHTTYYAIVLKARISTPGKKILIIIIINKYTKPRKMWTIKQCKIN